MKFTSFTKISMHLNLIPETNIEIPSVELSRNEPRSGQEVALVKKLIAFSIPSLLFARDALETSARSCPDNFFGIRLIFPPAEKHHGRTNPRNPVAEVLPVTIGIRRPRLSSRHFLACIPLWSVKPSLTTCPPSCQSMPLLCRKNCWIFVISSFTYRLCLCVNLSVLTFDRRTKRSYFLMFSDVISIPVRRS